MFSVDNKQRIVSTVEKLPDDTIISGFEYEYDEIGRISSEKLLDKNQKFCYTYDVQSRVTKRIVLNLDDNTSTEETFTYDAAGNITADDASVFVYDTNNRLTQCNGNPVSYDLDGNMLTDGSLVCTYDSANRLITASGHTYTYNAENVRIRNLCADADTTYVYNTNGKLSQLLTMTKNGVVTKFVYGLGLIGEETNNTFKTYHFDYRGSTVAITDANGNITDTFAYDTYGKQTARTGTSNVIFAYNGRDGVVTDANGLIYMRARYYCPELRRFVNADIVAGDISNAVTLNRFAYANGNPVSFVDPFGLSADSRGNTEDSKQDKNVTLDLEKQFEEQKSNHINSLKTFQNAIRKELSYTGDMAVTIYLPHNTEVYYKVSSTVGDGSIDLSDVAGSLFDVATTVPLENGKISTTFGIEGSVGIKGSMEVEENLDAFWSASMDMGSIDVSFGATLDCGEAGSVSVKVGLKHEFSPTPQSPKRAEVKVLKHSFVLQNITVPAASTNVPATQVDTLPSQGISSYATHTPMADANAAKASIGAMGFGAILFTGGIGVFYTSRMFCKD